MAISSQGTTLSFNGVSYVVTSIAVNYGGGEAGAGSGGAGGPRDNRRQRVSAAYLDSDPEKAEPYFEIWQPDPTGEGRLDSEGGTAGTFVQHSVQIEFIGPVPPEYRATGPLSISGPVNLTFSAATCESSSVRLAVGDFVRGSASFKVQ
jgi:hypothetical protein